MKESLSILQNFGGLEGVIFTNGFYYAGVSQSNGNWVIEDELGISAEVEYALAFKMMVLRNMYPEIVIFKNHNKDILNLQELAQVADKVDKNICISIPKKEDCWVCNECKQFISEHSYECNKCRIINWDQFYKIKSNRPIVSSRSNQEIRSTMKKVYTPRIERQQEEDNVKHSKNPIEVNDLYSSSPNQGNNVYPKDLQRTDLSYNPFNHSEQQNSKDLETIHTNILDPCIPIRNSSIANRLKVPSSLEMAEDPDSVDDWLCSNCKAANTISASTCWRCKASLR